MSSTHRAIPDILSCKKDAEDVIIRSQKIVDDCVGELKAIQREVDAALKRPPMVVSSV